MARDSSFPSLSFVNCGGFLVEAGQARDVAGDDADPDESVVIPWPYDPAGVAGPGRYGPGCLLML
jgi:hypothetical protein